MVDKSRLRECKYHRIAHLGNSDFSTETEQIFGDMLMQVVRVEPIMKKASLFSLELKKKDRRFLIDFVTK